MRQSAERFELRYSTLSNMSLSQRLESGDFIYPYLVGLIEGDGWFTVTKNGKYLMYEFGIELSIKDVQLIYFIKKLLGVGTIFFRQKSRKIEDSISSENNVKDNVLRRNTVMFRIRNKSHLKEIIIPIFDKYSFFTDKKYDYIKFRTLLLSNVIFSEELINYTKPLLGLNTVKSILNAFYFPAWLIGFIEAESCFSVYKPVNDSSYVASFEITQTNSEIILLAIKEYLNLTPNVTKDSTNNYKIKATSIRNIENVIKFMTNAPLKLIGYKKLQYIIWLKKLRGIPRYYHKIKIPSRY